MKIASRLGLAAMLLGLFIQPAIAAVSPWSYSEGGRMRIAALSDGIDGRITAILEIQPHPGWKTYWRDPGDAGVAPQIDLSAAQNLDLLKVDYPVPEVGKDEGGRFFGYHQAASLVLEFKRPDSTKAAVLSANVLIGICKDICLPFQSTFELPLDDISQPQADEFMAIQLARAELPEMPSDGFKVTRSGLTADKQYFEVTVTAPGKAMPEIAIAPTEGLLLGKLAEIIIQDGETAIRYPVKRLPKSLDGAAVTLLVKAAGRAMETTLAVK